MKKRLAVMDLGTNVFHLLIADLEEDRVKKVISRQKRDVRLGEESIGKNIISQPAFERAIKALHDFKTIINENDADEVHAVGTSAFRNATNAAQLIKEAEEKTGISINVISGDREAELIYTGVSHSHDLQDLALIMDIGGGSVEFIFCDKKEVLCKKSYPIGAARLMDRFHNTDPISEANILAIYDYLEEILKDLKINGLIFRPEVLIGAAGAFETFAALTVKKYNLHSQPNAKSFTFQLAHFQSVLSDILSSTHTERAANELIPPVRTDMIVVAAVLAQWIRESLYIPKVQLSAYSLKEGLLFENI